MPRLHEHLPEGILRSEIRWFTDGRPEELVVLSATGDRSIAFERASRHAATRFGWGSFTLVRRSRLDKARTTVTLRRDRPDAVRADAERPAFLRLGVTP